jgi:hypothetical protein
MVHREYIYFSCFKFVTIGTASTISNSLRLANGQDLKQRLMDVKKYRKHYTYAGVLDQIELFFKDPFGVGGGLLKCASKLPTTLH